MAAKREHSCLFILSTQFLIVHVACTRFFKICLGHRCLPGDDGQLTGEMGHVYVMYVIRFVFLKGN